MGDNFGVHAGEHVPGEVMHKYLNAYADKWGLRKRTSLGTKVSVIKRLEDDQEDCWRLSVQAPRSTPDENPAFTTIRTRKLIISTGVTSNPHLPSIAGEENFDAPIVHTAALGRQQGVLFKDSDVKKVAVLGGGKSAYDAVHMAACEGREVVWLMRRSGRGPAWVFPSHTNIGPFKAWREVRESRPT